MKTFCELYFSGTHLDLENFINEIQQSAQGNWTSGTKNFSGVNWVYFDYTGTEVDKASVCIPFHSPNQQNELSVSNIVPLEKGQLSIDEYNAVLRQFYIDIILPYKSVHNDITISEITDDNFNPTTVITETALRKLKLFCNAANKSTGSSHPSDQERWFDFICQTVEDDKMFDASTLSKFLQDEDYWGKKEDNFLGVMGHFAWDESLADRLALEYEQSCEILLYYKRTRGI